MISYSSGIAVYRQVADIFREQINSGELTEGTTLPSYKTLSLHYNVSIETVQKAIGILRNEGRLDVFRGKQAQVRPARAVETITAPPQARVSVRMPTPDERIKLNITAVLRSWILQKS